MQAAALRPEDLELLRDVAIRCIDSTVAGLGRMIVEDPEDFAACVYVDDEWFSLEHAFYDTFVGNYLLDSPEISVYDRLGYRKPDSIPEDD
jgi:hypothetical protein